MPNQTHSVIAIRRHHSTLSTSHHHPKSQLNNSQTSGSGFCESIALDSASSNTTATSNISAPLFSETDSISLTLPDSLQMASLAVPGGIVVDPNQAQWLSSFQGEQLGEESTSSRDYLASYNANYGRNGSSQDYGISHGPISLDEYYCSRQDMDILDLINLDDLFGEEFNR
jgi:hypothetical protein